MDLQKRANDLAAQASNKLSFLSGNIKLSYNNLYATYVPALVF